MAGLTSSELMRNQRRSIDMTESSLAASSAADGASSCRNELRPRDGMADEYVEALVARYVSLPGTPTSARAVDRRCARALYLRGVPLETAEAALVVAIARRTLRSPDRPPLAPVRALHYFLPIIDELLEAPSEPGYVAYLARRLQPWMKPHRSR